MTLASLEANSNGLAVHLEHVCDLSSFYGSDSHHHHRWHEMDRSIMIGIEILAFGAAVWFLNLMQNDLTVPGL